jgi:hypothetical protein
MELVEGQPITTYCEERRLGIESRLRVLLEVCDAAQYAHRNLVVHAISNLPMSCELRRA